MAINDVSFRAISQTRAFLRITEGAEVYVKGKVRVTEVVSGALRVLGSNLTSSSPASDVYSPRGYSLLNMRAVRPLNPTDDDRQVGKRLEALGLEDEKVGGGGCLFVLERLETPWSHILDHYLPFCHNNNPAAALFSRDSGGNSNLVHLERVLDVNVWTDIAECKSRTYKESSQWEVAVKSAKIALTDLSKLEIHFFSCFSIFYINKDTT